MSKQANCWNLPQAHQIWCTITLFFSKIKHYFKFNVHGSMHCKNIPIYIQQDATLHSLFYLETALHVSGPTSTHHQERKNCIYTIWYLSHHYCYLPLSWKSWNCSSNSSKLAAGSSNGVTNTRWCIQLYDYSMCDYGWRYHLKHVEQFPYKINCVALHLVGYILE